MDMLELASSYCRTDDAEIEAVFSGVSSNEFKKLLTTLCVDVSPVQRLDVTVRNQRFSFTSAKAIHAYTSKNCIYDAFKVPEVVLKKLISRYHDPSGFAVNLKMEKPIRANLGLLFDVHVPPISKHYRYMKRWSVVSATGYRIDLSVVRGVTSSLLFAIIPRNDFTETYEVEVEYVGSKGDGPQAVVDTLALGATRVLDCLESDDVHHQLAEEVSSKIAADYANLVGFKAKSALIGPNPVTLGRINLLEPDVDIVSLRKGYLVTEKADGVRAGLFIASDGRPYVAKRKGEFGFAPWPTSRTFPELAMSYLDCEMVEEPREKLLVFDAYYVAGRLVADMNLHDRIQEMGRFDGIIEGVFVKKYRPAEEACRLLDEVNVHMYDHQVDGLIYMPEDLPVGGKFAGDSIKLTGNWDRVFKWKPPNMNSIDFLVDLDKKRGVAYLYLDWSPLHQRISPTEYYSGSVNEAIAVKVNNRKLFEPVPTTRLEFDEAANGYLCDNGDRIESGSIVEFFFKDLKFVPMRVRDDKTKGNFYDVAMDVWNSIQVPVTRDHVCFAEKVTDTKESLMDQRYWLRDDKIGRHKASIKMREFHYWMKAKLFVAAAHGTQFGGATLMDLGCGKAGDMNRWTASGFDRVLGVDLFDDSITNGKDGAFARVSAVTGFEKCVFAMHDVSTPLNESVLRQHPEKGGENDHIEKQHRAVLLSAYGIKGGLDLGHGRNGIAIGGFDAVACMFAMHYFFKSREAFDGLLCNIVDNLKQGGRFIGCCFEAERVEALLEANGGAASGRLPTQGDRTMWSIEAAAGSSSSVFGKRIDVYVDSINRKTPEYLVDFDYLQERLIDHGIRLEDTGMFGDSYQEYSSGNRKDRRMEEVEKTFSFLNRWFVFRRA